MSSSDSDDTPGEVREFLGRVHPVSNARLEEVSNVDVLREIAVGRQEFSRKDRIRAAVVLARLGADEETDVEKILRSIATDPRTDIGVRTAAVSAFGYLPPETAERALLDFLDTDADRLRVAAATAIGVVGGRVAFEALERFARSDEGVLGDPRSFEHPLTRAGAFARAVVSYRLHADGVPSFGVDGVDRTGLREAARIRSRRVDGIAGALETTIEPLYAIPLRTDSAIEFVAGSDTPSRMAVLLNEEIADDPAERLFEEPALAAIGLSYRDETHSYEPSLLAFSAPDGDRLEVTICRLDGTALYAGAGTRDGDGIEVRLTDTGLIGTAPTRFRFELSDGGLSLEEGVARPDQRRVRSPASFDE